MGWKQPGLFPPLLAVPTPSRCHFTPPSEARRTYTHSERGFEQDIISPSSWGRDMSLLVYYIILWRLPNLTSPYRALVCIVLKNKPGINLLTTPSKSPQPSWSSSVPPCPSPG